MLAETVDFLKKDNERNCNRINELTSELSAAKLKINELENYNRRDNLIINGLYRYCLRRKLLLRPALNR